METHQRLHCACVKLGAVVGSIQQLMVKVPINSAGSELPDLTDMISVSLEGISQRDMRVFWKVMHQIEANLIQMAQGDTIVD